ncbi:hypothetical protein CBR_g41265 [Chara braunii]|uniref:Integrase catalytic domain-containing protein n=1 Tax=Chara braunii TaxID=69332 RepID=A0A388LVI5_CHABU|nr:hypothetical protein CBR_g41265 [Chara braunii]|eukprot:GBG86271.1 hypothetical protein CBR_g41265 [Chara braunii]
MFVDNDGSTIEVDEHSQEGVGSEAGSVETSEGGVVAAVPQKGKATGRRRGGSRSRSQVDPNGPRWEKAGLTEDVWRDRYSPQACIRCGQYGHSQYKCRNKKCFGKHVGPVGIVAVPARVEVVETPSPSREMAQATDSSVVLQTRSDPSSLCSMNVFESFDELEVEWSRSDPLASWTALVKAPKGEMFVNEVVIGGRKAGAYYDTCSTRNFISRECVERLRLQGRVQRLSRPVESTCANKQHMVVNDYLQDVECCFPYAGGDLRHRVSFLVSDELPMDMLLGMYYLSVAQPQFDWDRKVVKHNLPGGGTARLHKFKASSLIESYGCMCAAAFYNYYKQNQEEGMYLVSVSAAGEPVKMPPEIEGVVAKYPNLFEEPTGVVEREVVHAIEIIPGSSIPKGRIRMSPGELDELRRQLKELVEKVEEHVAHLDKVLSLLRQHKFKINGEKCEFGRTRVLYLGHEISAEGLKPDDAKVASIRDWPRPQSVTEMRSFLGMTGYYMTFVKNYNILVAPLTDLTRLDTPLEWQDECEAAFRHMKHALTHYEVLKLPNPGKPFIVTTDASQYGIGAVLAQQEGLKLRPVEYMSKKMSSQKLPKSTYEKELYAVYKALTHWRHYLLGRFFILKTDHQTLRWMRTQPVLSDALKRWIEVIEQYDFDPQYLKGEYNKVADALSRRPDFSGALITKFDLTDHVTQSLVEAYREDQFMSEIIRRLEAKDNKTSAEFELVNGLLFLEKDGNKRLCVPNSESLRSLFLGEFHDATGHFGYKKTATNLLQRFWWPSMMRDAQLYVETCQVCQRDKPRTQAPLGLLKPLPISERPGESLSMDFMDTLITSKSGMCHIFVIVDRFSKYTRLVPMSETAKTEYVIRMFKENWVRDFGLPKSIVSDRDVRFTSELWKAAAAEQGTQLQMTSGNHPEANEQAEQLNRAVQHLLRHYMKPNQVDWDEKLALIASLYNNAVHSATGMLADIAAMDLNPDNEDSLLYSILPHDIYKEVNGSALAAALRSEKLADVLKKQSGQGKRGGAFLSGMAFREKEKRGSEDNGKGTRPITVCSTRAVSTMPAGTFENLVSRFASPLIYEFRWRGNRHRHKERLSYSPSSLPFEASFPPQPQARPTPAIPAPARAATAYYTTAIRSRVRFRPATSPAASADPVADSGREPTFQIGKDRCQVDDALVGRPHCGGANDPAAAVPKASRNLLKGGQPSQRPISAGNQWPFVSAPTEASHTAMSQQGAGLEDLEEMDGGAGWGATLDVQDSGSPIGVLPGKQVPLPCPSVARPPRIPTSNNPPEVLGAALWATRRSHNRYKGSNDPETTLRGRRSDSRGSQSGEESNTVMGTSTPARAGSASSPSPGAEVG